MARYFFNVLDGHSPADDDGTELPDLDTVRREAIRLCGEILREVAGQFDSDSEWRLDVRDARDITLFTLRFSVQA